VNDPTKKPGEPDNNGRHQEDDADVERQQPVRRGADDADIGEVPARRGGTDSGDIERGTTPPPGREGHEREMQERRPHRDEPV